MVDLQEPLTHGRSAARPKRKKAQLGGVFYSALGGPGVLWMLAFVILPLYAVAAVAFGTVDPILRIPVAAWNPLQWNFSDFSTLLSSIISGPLANVFVRTGVYVLAGTVGCILIGYPVAYYLARYGGRFRSWILAGLVLPFLISYMLRMLAWVTLLQPDGYLNKILSYTPIGGGHNWLGGSGFTVVLGLIYGYVPYFILALWASLERLDPRHVEAARDLGASPRRAFLRVTLPLSIPGLLAATAIVVLPMCGDYYTNTFLTRGATSTEMIGNQIEHFLLGSSEPQRGAALVLILMAVLLVFMAYYIRTVRVTEKELTR
ncbi:ABC transporter permease [Mycolicibacterium sp. YH-1]|uniref:ABC transporter permease n=1 Tax=Mycolicibacterium sp. YH-1 TaxID=2908837 RepID=UPI001F4C2F08|nr:ABC transporter permease [Mycolicibacterium sp. YH-1]UNB52973.1 ABC transporter permease [Mycolicibacterium sp. YH-1]